MILKLYLRGNEMEESIAYTITPKSDQANADDLIASPATVQIVEVRKGDKESPVWITTTGFDGRPWKPCKSMRRVLVAAWGEYPSAWIGRSVTLFCDPEVVYGGVKVGGIRISHMSDIAADLALSLTATRGKRKPFTVRRLDIAMYPADLFAEKFPAMRGAIAAGKMTAEQVISHAEKTGKLTEEQKAAISAALDSEVSQ
jgi:hypothetical protein